MNAWPVVRGEGCEAKETFSNLRGDEKAESIGRAELA